MRRVRALLAFVVLVISLRCVPSGWSKREATALWTDEIELQQSLARGTDRWRHSRLDADHFMTSSDRFDGEWLFGTYMMGALGYLQTARAHPELAKAHLAAADECIDHILQRRVRSFDRAAWSSDPVRDLGTNRAHAAYLGYLNLVLSLRRVLAPDSPHAELNDRISAHLDAALDRSPRGLIETYPGEVYPVDNAAVLASLALHQRVTGTDHQSALDRWNAKFDDLRDPTSGLLIQAVSYADAKPLDAPRGSGTGLAAYFLSFSDPQRSYELYEAMRSELHVSTMGFSAMREYPRGMSGRGDIDSGPVILGLSISSTGFALAASRAHQDEDTFSALWATTYLFGAPVDRDGARNFAFGGPLGDAMMFALLTARPATDWSPTS